MTDTSHYEHVEARRKWRNYWKWKTLKKRPKGKKELEDYMFFDYYHKYQRFTLKEKLGNEDELYTSLEAKI